MRTTSCFPLGKWGAGGRPLSEKLRLLLAVKEKVIPTKLRALNPTGCPFLITKETRHLPKKCPLSNLEFRKGEPTQLSEWLRECCSALCWSLLRKAPAGYEKSPSH